MNRKSRASLAQETLKIIDQGWYDNDNSERICIQEQVADCLKNTRLIRPQDFSEILGRDVPQDQRTIIEVSNETTLSAAQRKVEEYGSSEVLVLNFASAKNPGGGFLGGSQAQEESLARSSALYSSLLTQQEYYDANRSCRSAFYTDHMILSPQVPVFRNDDGQLLMKPYLVSILTAPAVNAGAVKNNHPEKVDQIIPAMAARIEKVLALAAMHGYQHLILGAWGCGVFQNDPNEIARLFSKSLLGEGRFSSCFASISFAVLDRTAEAKIYTPFQDQFLSGYYTT